MGELTDTIRRDYCNFYNSYLTEYIKVADAKVGLILTSGTGLGLILSAAGGELMRVTKDGATSLRVILIGCYVAAVMAAVGVVFFAFRALRPRTPQAFGSLNSFPDVSGMKQVEYVSAIEALSGPDAVAKNVALHNFALASVANSKFRDIKTALWYLRVEMMLALLIGVLYVMSFAG